MDRSFKMILIQFMFIVVNNLRHPHSIKLKTMDDFLTVLDEYKTILEKSN
jgi:hypothetical protein